MSYERDNIQKMAGYTSGEQPDSDDIIKLNTNENPFPPGPAVAKALSNLKVESLRRYPPPTATALQKSIAQLHGVEQHSVIVTNGGDELLRLAISTFVEKDQAIAVAEPSYSLYRVLAEAYGCSYLAFDLDDNWQFPENYAQKLNAAGAKLCFVVNPQAPSGQLLKVEELRQLASEFKGVLMIDEAYVDFVDPVLGYNAVSLINEFDNILILRTFSKGYSLAGLRMAYGLGAKSLIDPMQYKTKDSFNTDVFAQLLAKAAIEDQDYARQSWSFVISQRKLISDELNALGFHCLASQSNFLLCTVPSKHNAETIYLALKEEGILVRYFNLKRLQTKLRITIGTESENQCLLKALKKILSENTV